MEDRIWISWNLQRRNIGLANAVHARLFMSEYNNLRWLRIPREFLRSWNLIRKERPTICFTMNPSIFASWWLSILAKFYRFLLISDLHTLNIKISGLKKNLFLFFFNSGIRRSDIVIVTNKYYRQSIVSLNPNVVCIPDALPTIRQSAMISLKKDSKTRKKMQVLFICSFGPDEPVSEILSIDSSLDGFEILVSGDWRKEYKVPPETRNIRLIGYVSQEEYDRILCSVDGIMVLTREEGCLCCGAYEAFSAGKSLILSHTQALEDFFGKAPIYTENNSKSILSALRILRAEKTNRATLIINERPTLQRKFNEGIRELERVITSFKQ